MELLGSILNFKGRIQDIHPTGKYLAIEYFGSTYLYETSSKKVHFHVRGYDGCFSPAGDTFLILGWFNQLPCYIYDVATGQLNEIIKRNSLSDRLPFSRKSNLAPNLSENDKWLAENLYEENKTQLISQGSNDIVYVYNGGRYITFSPDSRWLAIHDSENDMLQVVSLSSQKVVYQARIRSWRLNFTHDSRWLAIEEDSYRTPTQLWMNMSTGLLHGAYGKILSSPQYTFIQTGKILDVFGEDSIKPKWFANPRPYSGLGRIRVKQLALYDKPHLYSKYRFLQPPNSTIYDGFLITSTAPSSRKWNGFLVNILGRSANGGWVYVHNLDQSHYGWLPIESVEVIQSWEDTPILDENDPMGSLARMMQ